MYFSSSQSFERTGKESRLIPTNKHNRDAFVAGHNLLTGTAPVELQRGAVTIDSRSESAAAASGYGNAACSPRNQHAKRLLIVSQRGAVHARARRFTYD